MGSVKLALGVALVLYLATTNELYHVFWLACNLLDTFRATRVIRPNGRRIGAQTRRRAMKEALTCWIAYQKLALRRISGIPERLFGWLPFYAPVKLVLFAGFMFTRTSTSASFLASFLRPWLRRYEAHIDLTFSLLSSATALLFYCTVMPPILALTRAISTLRTVIQKVKTSLTGALASSTIQANDSEHGGVGKARNQPKIVIDLTGEEELSRQPPVTTTQAQVAQPHIARSAARTRPTKKTPRPTILAPSIVVDDSPTDRHMPSSSRAAAALGALLTPPQSPKSARGASATLLVPTMAPTLRRSPRRHAGNRASPFSVDVGDDREPMVTSQPTGEKTPAATKKTTRNLMAALDALPPPPTVLSFPDDDVFLVPPNAKDRQNEPSTQAGASREFDIPVPRPLKVRSSKASTAAPAAKRKAAAEIAPAAKKPAIAPLGRTVSATGSRTTAAPDSQAAGKRRTAGGPAPTAARPSTRPTAAQRSVQTAGTIARSDGAGSISTKAKSDPETSGTTSGAARTKVSAAAPTRSKPIPPHSEVKPVGPSTVRPGKAVTASERTTRRPTENRSSANASATAAGTKRKTSAMGAPSKRIKRDD